MLRSPVWWKGTMHPFVHLSVVFWLYTALQCGSSISSNSLVFHTSGWYFIKPCWFPILIFFFFGPESSCCVNCLSLVLKSDLTDKIKRRFFPSSGRIDTAIWMHNMQKQDDQLEHTYSSYVRIWDVVLKTCQRRWTIGRSSERGFGISVLAPWWWWWWWWNLLIVLPIFYSTSVVRLWVGDCLGRFLCLASFGSS